jgi:hypothetical protein
VISREILYKTALDAIYTLRERSNWLDVDDAREMAHDVADAVLAELERSDSLPGEEQK